MLDATLTRVIVLVACASLFVICDTLAAYWGKFDSTRALYALIPLAPFSYIMFGYINKRYPLAIASSYVNIALCTATILIGYFVFADELTVRQWVGVALAFAAMLMMI